MTPTGFVEYPAHKVLPRFAAYGIVLSSAGVLLVQSTMYKKFWLPGGGQEKNEGIEAALLREIYEETGLQADILQKLDSRRDYIHVGTDEYAYDQRGTFYVCRAPAKTPTAIDKTDDAQNPVWVPLRIAQQSDYVIASEYVRGLMRSAPVTLGAA